MKDMILTGIVLILAVVGLVLCGLGLISLVRGKLPNAVRAAIKGQNIEIPLSATLLFLGVGTMGGAVWLGAKLPSLDSAPKSSYVGPTTSSSASPVPATETTPASPTPMTSTAISTDKAMQPQISEPADGTKVGGREGVLLSGSALGLAGDSLVLMTISDSPEGKVFYLSQDHPLAPAGESWSALIRPIGAGSSDVGEIFTIVLVRATGSTACLEDLFTAKPHANGDIYFKTLPAGCKEADRVNVIKESP